MRRLRKDRAHRVDNLRADMLLEQLDHLLVRRVLPVQPVLLEEAHDVRVREGHDAAHVRAAGRDAALAVGAARGVEAAEHGKIRNVRAIEVQLEAVGAAEGELGERAGDDEVAEAADGLVRRRRGDELGRRRGGARIAWTSGTCGAAATFATPTDAALTDSVVAGGRDDFCKSEIAGLLKIGGFATGCDFWARELDK